MTTTTNRLDIVMTNQRRMMFLNVATTFAIMTSIGASILAML